MRIRTLSGALLLIGALIPITSCNNSPGLTSIVVTPNVMNFGGTGLTTQLTATGYYTHPHHPAIQKDITTQVTWSTSTPDCVTVSSTGLITSGANVCSNIPITASMPGFNGLISGSMTVNVTQPAGGGGGNTVPDVTSIALIPSSATVATINETVQFVAVGTLSGGLGTVDLTSIAKWRSSESSVASINTTGLATALTAGTTTISATFTNQDGTSASGSATLTVSPSQTTEPLVGLAILPGAQTVNAIGQTAQFVAIGTTGSGTTVDLTAAANLTWTSTITSVGTIGAHTGLATATGGGTTAINAIATNPDGTVVTSSSSFNVNISSTTGEPLLSLAIIPTSQSVSAIGETSQYIAIGTFSSSAATTTSICNSTGVMQDCTNYVSWSSSDVAVGTISKNGLATAVSTSSVPETTAITAIATNPDGTVVTGEATFTAGVGTINPLQSTLAVTLIGTGANNGLVTAPAPGTAGPLVISCTTVQGATCSQPFTTGAVVTLTATPQNGAQFGGWSNNCAPINANQCQITMTTNETVAAIFY